MRTFRTPPTPPGTKPIAWVPTFRLTPAQNVLRWFAAASTPPLNTSFSTYSTAIRCSFGDFPSGRT